MNRLMIGCGSSAAEGWHRLDASPEYHPDFLVRIPPIPEQVRTIQWDEIEWIHGISSLYSWEVPQLLRELHEALRNGGKLVLEQPNADVVLRAVSDGGPLYWIFGDPQHQNSSYMNHWLYTPTSLTTLLRQAGFRQVLVERAQHHLPNRDFRLEAIA